MRWHRARASAGTVRDYIHFCDTQFGAPLGLLLGVFGNTNVTLAPRQRSMDDSEIAAL